MRIIFDIAMFEVREDIFDFYPDIIPDEKKPLEPPSEIDPDVFEDEDDEFKVFITIH